MKIFLNLLPEDKKKEIRRNNRIRMIIWQEFVLLSIIIFFISVLLSVSFILKIQLDGLENIYAFEQSQENFKELKKYEDEFERINSKTNLLFNATSNSFYWTRVLREFNVLVADSIFLTDLASKNYTISIVGKASSRDTLLEFQENINKSECFDNIKAPLSNLVMKENVDFQIDFTVNEECLKSEHIAEN